MQWGRGWKDKSERRFEIEVKPGKKGDKCFLNSLSNGSCAGLEKKRLRKRRATQRDATRWRRLDFTDVEGRRNRAERGEEKGEKGCVRLDDLSTYGKIAFYKLVSRKELEGIVGEREEGNVERARKKKGSVFLVPDLERPPRFSPRTPEGYILSKRKRGRCQDWLNDAKSLRLLLATSQRETRKLPRNLV